MTAVQVCVYVNMSTDQNAMRPGTSASTFRHPVLGKLEL